MDDALAAYMLDRAATVFGVTIENALLERSEADDGGRSHSVYTLTQLLTPDFHLPRPGHEPVNISRMDGMLYDEVG
jgi:hypothetical protein